MTDLLKLYDSLQSPVVSGQLSDENLLTDNRQLITDNLLAEARSWLGTPFKHQGRLKGVGCDCLGLLIGVAAALDLQGKGGQKLADLDNLSYGHFPDENALRAGLDAALYPAENLSAGCIVLIKIEGRAQHLGMIGSLESGVWSLEENQTLNSKLQTLTLIHAYAPHRKVVEHRLSEEWWERIVAIYQNRLKI